MIYIVIYIKASSIEIHIHKTSQKFAAENQNFVEKNAEQIIKF